MSRRGGSRRPETRREQPMPTTSRSSHRGGAGRRGRGASAIDRDPPSTAPSTSVPPPVAPSQSAYPLLTTASASSSAPPPRKSPAQAPAPAPAPAPVPAPASASASRLDTSLSGEVEKKLTLQAPPSQSSKAFTIPRRPGYGTIGRKIVVRANHFLVEVADNDHHHYDVSITPEVSSKKVCRDVMIELSKMYRESHLGRRSIAFDGGKSLYVAGSLPFNSKEFVVKLVDNDRAGSSSNRREREFKVAIKFASRPDLHHLQQFISGRQRDIPQETIQMLDVVLRAAPSEKYTVVGRSFFHPNLGHTGELGEGIEYWKGFYQSLRPTQMGLSLNIDVSARSFYEPILVTEFVAKHLNIRDLSRPLSDLNRVKIKKALRGVKVELTCPGSSRRYKISGLSAQPAGKLMFSLDDGTNKSVFQYFGEKYQVTLKCFNLPAIQAGTDAKPIYLPMEVCKIVGGQRYTKRLNEKQVTAILKATCQRPQAREGSIKQIVRQNNYNQDQRVRDEFGIRVRDELTLVDARVLPPPMLKYGKEQNVGPQMGKWNMMNKKMFNGGRVEFWTCLNFSSQVNRDLPYQLCEQLMHKCNAMGMAFNPNPLIPIEYAHARDIERALAEVHSKSLAKLKSVGQEGRRLQLLIIILPDISGSYGKIKRVCETELGIVSQCCRPRLASTKFDNVQFLENLALKINVKVGGRNTVLNDAIQRNIPLVTDRPTIFFGADVTHPQPGEDSSPSIAAVVASMDWPEITKYRGLMSAQAHRDEIIQDLYKQHQDPQRGLVHGGMIRELLIAFRRSTGHKPSRIIFYRDGVSEGQFNQVLLYEMDAIRKACASLEEGYLPPVTFLVVQKRHHTRLFPADPSRQDQADRTGNILAGTVVEHKICHPTEFDFYLNSHAGLQGTSRPAHYHVLYDENNFTPDKMQMLTNSLCYTYARCTRSVSIVPPAYYAHLAAFRARYYIEGDVSESGSTTSAGRNIEFRPLPAIKDNVKDVMFYC